jgi:hypothetical protein
MNKQPPNVEWHIAHSDADWERLQGLALPESEPTANRPRPLLHYLWRMAALLLPLVTGGSGWWHPEQATLIPLATSEMAGAQSGLDIVAYSSDKGGHQLYQRTAGGWQQTQPDATLWGAERSLETPYFVYRFREKDAPPVIAVAPQIDALYSTLWHNFGLPITLTPEKRVIEVSVTQAPGSAPLWADRQDPIRVPSPAVYLASVELTDAEMLAQSIALPLIEEVLRQTREHHAIESSWQPLLDGLRLWQVWDLDLPLATWRVDVVQWLYLELPATRPGASVTLLDQHPEFCAAHKLWMSSPLQLDIPVVCGDRDWGSQYLAGRAASEPLTRLNQIVVPAPTPLTGFFFPAAHSSQTVALATLIDYAMTTYGRERLPTLLAGLGQYERWETLLPTVYGVLPAEFEAGWQGYLAAHYGVAIQENSNRQNR